MEQATNWDLTSPEFAKKICSIENEEERTALFAVAYFDKHQYFPNKLYNNLFYKIIKDENLRKIYDKVLKVGGKILQEFEKLPQKMLLAFKTGLSIITCKITILAIKSFLARAVVRTIIGIAFNKNHETSLLSSKIFLHSAITFGSKSLAIAMAQFVGELVTDFATDFLQVENNRIKKYSSITVGILVAIIIGALIGGEVGALGAIIVSLISTIVTETIFAFGKIKKVSKDNHVTIVTGIVDSPYFATYLKDDINYEKISNHTEFKSNMVKNMSAGQNQKEAFKITIWKNSKNFNKNFYTFQNIHYRDYIYCSKIDGKYIIIIGYGSFSDTPLQTKKIIL